MVRLGFARRFGPRFVGLWLIAAMLAGPVSAVAPFTFWLVPGSHCVSGNGPVGQPLSVSLRSASGHPLGHFNTTTDGTGHWASHCFSVSIKPGDRLMANHNNISRTLIVPPLTAIPERIHNHVTGRAPAGKTVDLLLWSCTPFVCLSNPVRHALVSGAGHLDYNYSPTDIDGGDYVEADFHTNAGDVISFTGAAPNFWARELGDSSLFYFATTPGPVTFRLRAAGGALLATTTLQRHNGGGYLIHFQHNGAPVKIKAGDVITGDFASDARMVVLDTQLAWSTSQLQVYAKCFPNQGYQLFVGTSSGGSYYPGNADANGNILANVNTLDPGEQVVLDCENKVGDDLRTMKVVP